MKVINWERFGRGDWNERRLKVIGKAGYHSSWINWSKRNEMAGRTVAECVCVCVCAHWIIMIIIIGKRCKEECEECCCKLNTKRIREERKSSQENARKKMPEKGFGLVKDNDEIGHLGPSVRAGAYEWVWSRRRRQGRAGLRWCGCLLFRANEPEKRDAVEMEQLEQPIKMKCDHFEKKKRAVGKG